MESAVALPNALVDEAERTYDASMFFTAEQRQRAALVSPIIHVAFNYPSDAALTEASNRLPTARLVLRISPMRGLYMDSARTVRKGNLTH